MVRRSIWWSWGVSLVVVGSPSGGWALPSGEVVGEGGMVSYGYQIGGLGEFDDSGHHLDVDFGVTDQSGVGLSLSRMFGSDSETRQDIDITVGSVYGKYQLLEVQELPGAAVAAYLGYHWTSFQDETLSGVGLGIMGSTYTPSGFSLHGRLGIGTRSGDDVIEFEIGVARAWRPELEAMIALRTFRAGDENEGGVVVGLTYHWPKDLKTAESAPW